MINRFPPMALLLLAGVVHTALADPPPERPAPQNRYGLPIIDNAGQRIVYQRDQLTNLQPITTQTRPAAAVASKAPASGGATASAVASVTAEPTRPKVVRDWSYAPLGSSIGTTGIAIAATSEGPEIIVAGNVAGDFGRDDHWVALRYSSKNGQYDQSYSSPQYEDGIVGLMTADLHGDGKGEILVLRAGGRLEAFAQGSKWRRLNVATPTAAPTALRVADVDGDRVGEIIVTDATDLYILRADGTLYRRVAGMGGQELVVGQMDDDPGLEIAVTSGKVYDVATDAVQWTHTGGFGARLRVADMDQDGRDELIAAEGWYLIWAYDVERKLPKWSISADLDIDAIEVADLTGDGVPELLYGDGQWGKIHVVDMATQTDIRQFDNPDDGVTNIAVRDVDGDGALEVLWGAGASSTGPDHLYVVDATSGAREWGSMHVDGPLIGPVVGDVDGDGSKELVVVSSASDAGYGSGRILVFTLKGKLRAVSGPVSDNWGWTGVNDVQLRDLDGDGASEILIATDNLYDGVIEAYKFKSGRFTLYWTNATRPEGAPFYTVDAADVDGDGQIEIVGGVGRAHTGSSGVSVYTYGLESAAQEWRSMQLGSYGDKVADLSLHDLDGDGGLEISALDGDGQLHVFDGRSKELKTILGQGLTSLMGLNGFPRDEIWAGDNLGYLRRIRSIDGNIGIRGGFQVAPAPVDGTAASRKTKGFLVASGGRIYLWMPDRPPWISPNGGDGYGRGVTWIGASSFAAAGVGSLDHYVVQ